jgi:hypothetical protein
VRTSVGMARLTPGISCETSLDNDRPDAPASSKILWLRQIHALVRQLVFPQVLNASFHLVRGLSDVTCAGSECSGSK